MPDMEKVIKALECKKNVGKRCGNPCEDTGACYYATAVRGLDGEIYRPFVCDMERVCEDALELLKEQHDTIDELQNAYGYLQKQLFEVQDELLEQETELCDRCGRVRLKSKWEGGEVNDTSRTQTGKPQENRRDGQA